MNELALFAGAGGGILGGKLLGWRTVCAVEWDAYARDVLVARQNDGCLDPFPIWDDVQTFDGKPWRGLVDVVSGGFPCQDISCAGKGAGIEGERSAMWKHMARIIGEVRPRFAFVENSPMLVGRGLSAVLADLAKMGYDARWGIVGAHHVAAPHKRDRIWIVANANCSSCKDQRMLNRSLGQRISSINESERCSVLFGISNGGAIVSNSYGERKSARISEPEQRKEGISEVINDGCDGGNVGNPSSTGFSDGATQSMGEPRKDSQFKRSDWWATEPDVGRVVNGVAARVDRLRALGNGQVPEVAALAWQILTDNIETERVTK
jgi:DNA (cytosine-5)-methyltransferase 1